MRRLMILIAASCAVGVAGCMSAYDVQNPVDIGKRVTMLRSEAVEMRKEAKDYELLTQKSRENLRNHQIRLESLDERKLELKTRLQALEAQKAAAKPEEASRVDRLITRYKTQLEAVLTQADGNRICMRNVEEQIEAQVKLRQAFLDAADQRDRAALALEGYAKQLAQK